MLSLVTMNEVATHSQNSYKVPYETLDLESQVDLFDSLRHTLHP